MRCVAWTAGRVGPVNDDLVFRLSMTTLFYPCAGLFVYSADSRELYLVEVDQFNDPKVKQQAPFSLFFSFFHYFINPSWKDAYDVRNGN
jgi:hypothetical protein